MQLVTYKTLVPVEHNARLAALADAASDVLRRMLSNRSEASTRFYREIPSALAKGLSNKYQRNDRCKSVSHICLPICGDKGRVVKLSDGGIRIPVAVMADLKNGHVRHMGFNPARTKSCWRGRKRNLQRQGKRRLLSKLREVQKFVNKCNRSPKPTCS